jgi:hypothetical protein
MTIQYQFDCWKSRLKAALKEQGVTYKQLAASFDLCLGAIGHRLNGRTDAIPARDPHSTT